MKNKKASTARRKARSDPPHGSAFIRRDECELGKPMTMNTNETLCDLWMNLCMADDGARLELVAGDEAEADKLLKAGLIARRGKWVWMTDKGIRAREIISA